jgi:3-deoxy-D-manno-octulosonic-acid transferase
MLLVFYNLFFPLAFLLAFPAWLFKMYRRGGFGTGLIQRFGIFAESKSEEKKGAIYIHAVSVGEALIAAKLIRCWQAMHPEEHFVFSVTTSTGIAVARQQQWENVKIIYRPVDFPFVVNSVLNRFAPKAIVLIESELWLNFLRLAKLKNIPLFLANARLSLRSERRYKQLTCYSKHVFAYLDCIFAQAKSDVQRWVGIGVEATKVKYLGSIKFDYSGGAIPQKRKEFAAILDRFSLGRKIILVVSSFPSEEMAIAKCLEKLRDSIFLVFAPRHMERRIQVLSDLSGAGYIPVLRSKVACESDDLAKFGSRDTCLIVDTTGELRDWTAHADLAIIGKSWLAKGGQNPTEAFAAKVPTIVGPRMDNFEPFITDVKVSGGVLQLRDLDALVTNVEELMTDKETALKMTKAAEEALSSHQGACELTVREVMKFL